MSDSMFNITYDNRADTFNCFRCGQPVPSGFGGLHDNVCPETYINKRFAEMQQQITKLQDDLNRLSALFETQQVGK